MAASRTARALLALAVITAAVAAACTGQAAVGGRTAGDATPTAPPSRSPDDAGGPLPATASGGTSSAPPLRPIPAPDEPGPDDAVAAYVTAVLDREYAGECLDTRLPDDAGRLCTVLVAQADGHRAYLAGRAFSEPTFWIFLRRGPPWTVYDMAPFDPFGHRMDEIPWPDATPPGTAPDLRDGMTVRVHGTGSCLPIRDGPAGEVVACLDEGATAVIDDGPRWARLYTWWHLERRGWVPAPYLRPE